MLKFILLGIGFIFLFEGLVYFFFTNQMKEMMKLIEEIDKDKIKSLAILISIIGASLIYFTIKFYQLS